MKFSNEELKLIRECSIIAKDVFKQNPSKESLLKVGKCNDMIEKLKEF